MLLGCTPDAASDTDSAVNGSTLEDSCLRDMALGCELLCHVACGADVPALKRCVEDMTFQVEIMKGIQNSSMPQVYFLYLSDCIDSAFLSINRKVFVLCPLTPWSPEKGTFLQRAPAPVPWTPRPGPLSPLFALPCPPVPHPPPPHTPPPHVTVTVSS